MSLSEGVCIREIQGLEIIILSGVNQTEEDNYHMICLYVESKEKKKKTIKTKPQTQIQRTGWWLP